MPNVLPNPAGAASASLVIDANRQSTAQPASPTQAVQSPQAVTLSTGEQVHLENYTVKKGDTLWDIAGVKMGNPNNWPVLFALNKAQISNPNLIHPGQVLMVPQKIQVAPTVPQQPMPSPEPVAPPVTPAAPSAVAEEVITPSQPASTAPVAEDVKPTPAPVASEPAAAAGPISQADLEWALQLQNKIEKENYQPNADEIARYKDLLAKAQAAEAAENAAASQPTAPATKPAEPGPIVLRPPDQLPPAAEETPAPVSPAQPEPVQPAPQPEQPKPPAIVGSPPIAENKKSALGKVALIGGTVGAATTGAVLIGMTAKIGSNLGGYATAQVVAKGINTVTSKVGLKLPTGPALTKLVSKVGGPKVAGTVAAVGTGLVVAGLAAGGYYLYKKATDKGEPAAQPTNVPPLPATAPTPAPAAAPTASAPASQAAAPISQADLEWAVAIQTKVEKEQYQPNAEEVARYQDLVARAEAAEKAAVTPTPAPATDAQGPLGNIQPVVDPKARPPVDVSPLHAKLGELLSQKQYIYFGSTTQPEQVREVGVQIWLDGKVDDRVKLANTLVSNGQSDLLGRVMSHQETTPEEIGEVMSHPQFPVGAYMKALNDGDAFQVLNSLSGLALKGNAPAAQVIAQTVTAYDGWRDREAPFNRLKQHHVAQGTWQQMPAELRGKIEELLK